MKLLSSRASGTTAEADSIALERPSTTGANAPAACLISRSYRFDLGQDAITLPPGLLFRKAGFDFGDLSRESRGFGCECIAAQARTIEIATEIVH